MSVIYMGAFRRMMYFFLFPLVVVLVIMALFPGKPEEKTNLAQVAPAQAPTAEPSTDEQKIEHGCEYVYKKRGDLTAADLEQIDLCKALGFYYSPKK